MSLRSSPAGRPTSSSSAKGPLRSSARSLNRFRGLMITVKYEDISLAFDFVSSAAPMLNTAFISLETGEIYWVSELSPLEEEVPDDLGESDRYVAIPHKNDLDLGSNLALSFA